MLPSFASRDPGDLRQVGLSASAVHGRPAGVAAGINGLPTVLSLTISARPERESNKAGRPVSFPPARVANRMLE